ncbi:UNVERIFIED_CONTAM: hypothetical protein Sradi_3140800 [Sesamum radiatum]|uniref:Reverse transcriptase domain-containing protein n=1 Tax=Sesamum radiatum TaxID=300843 RepID=A0AAW2REU2_SESRA
MIGRRGRLEQRSLGQQWLERRGLERRAATNRGVENGGASQPKEYEAIVIGGELGLRRGRFRESIAGKPPTTLDELLFKRAAKYIRIEEALKPKVDSGNKRKIREGERKDPRREGFHKDRGHNTEDCYHLKNEIEKLIQRGYLREYIENNPSGNNTTLRGGGGKELEEAESSRRREKGRKNLPTAGVIGVVTRGPAGGDSARARKALVRVASTPQEIYSCREVIITGKPEEEITFSSSDLEKGVPPHNDALVISATVSNFWVKKVLVDTGSAADILFFAAFSQMGIGMDMLTKVNTPLVGFNGSVVEPMGEIALPISIGTAPHRATRMLKFLVVDAPSSYNIIMGRPCLNSFKAVASTYHMKLKFPVYRGIGKEKGDRRTARECHANILKKKSKPPAERKPQIPGGGQKHMEIICGHSQPPSEQPDQQVKKRRVEEEKLAAAEELKNVQVVEGEPGKITSVGTTMTPRMEEELVQFLKANSN